ncbi:MAG TPA: phage tail tip lysozyme [Candidatus Saccharimonadales bacterium]|nr:phage tail tip lysozyme [Candidatus Saccharimonadales bacterium]
MNIKLKLTKSFQYFSLLVFVLSYLFAPFGQAVFAEELPAEERKAVSQYPNWVGKCFVGDPDSLIAGSGEPDGATFPSLDPTAMASAIDKFIEQENSRSKMLDLGQTIVASADNSDVSPFLIVAIAYKESSLSDPGDYNVSNGNNSFGRKAASGQPSFPGAGPNAGTSWYKWSTVKASVDHTARENQNATGGGDMASYLREVYGSDIDNGDILSLLTTYLGGDASEYERDVDRWVSEMVRLSGSSGGASAAQATPTSNNNVYLLGDSIMVGAYFETGFLKGDLRSAGWTAKVDASGGRGMNYAGSDPRGNLPGRTKSGLDAISADRAAIRASDTIVVELGTNESSPNLGAQRSSEIFKSEMVQAINKIKAINNSANIYWVNQFSNETQPYTPHVSEYNQAIEEVAQSKKINIINTVGKGITLSDGIHPDTDGYKKLSQIISSAIDPSDIAPEDVMSTASECCPPGAGGGGGTVLNGNSNEEKIWNFLVSDPDLQFTDIQAAAVLGNLEQESGFDPGAAYSGPINSDAYGIIQWVGNRRSGLEHLANRRGVQPNDLGVQLEYMKLELTEGYEPTGVGSYRSTVLEPMQAATVLRTATRIWLEAYEAPCTAGPGCDAEMAIRLPNAVNWLNRFGGSGGGGVAGGASASGPGCAGGGASVVGDANLEQTIKVSEPGRFITMPSRYGCGGTEHRIDSRIAAGVAYLLLKYDMCLTAGLEDGHASHGAGLAIDTVPKNGNSKADWKNSTEAAARAIGWYGDSADDPQGSQASCANYTDDGMCMHAVHPDKFPKWMRWLGYNGASCHGDPWHVFGGCGAHLHVGWDSPNGDATSSSVISEPIPELYTFPAPVPEDLRGLVD